MDETRIIAASSSDTTIEWVVIGLLALAIIYLFYRLTEEEKKSKKLTKENARIMAENAMLEAEQLKFQLQPHTLNNILANLKAVASKLHRGMDALSETLEYILYKGKGNMVSVENQFTFNERCLQFYEMFLRKREALNMMTL